MGGNFVYFPSTNYRNSLDFLIETKSFEVEFSCIKFFSYKPVDLE
jgi:hypothetical protein